MPSPPQRPVNRAGWGSPAAGDADEGKSGDGDDGGGEGPRVRRGARSRHAATASAAEAPADGASTTTKRRNRTMFDDDGGDDDIMEIPDLDEEEEEPEEDFRMQVAAAPRNMAKRLPSLHDLQRSLANALPEGNNSGADIAALKRFLVPFEQVQEGDETWEFETLLQQVSQEVTADEEAEEQRKAAAAEAAAKAEAATSRKAKAQMGAKAGRVSKAPVDGVVSLDDGFEEGKNARK